MHPTTQILSLKLLKIFKVRIVIGLTHQTRSRNLDLHNRTNSVIREGENYCSIIAVIKNKNSIRHFIWQVYMMLDVYKPFSIRHVYMTLVRKLLTKEFKICQIIRMGEMNKSRIKFHGKRLNLASLLLKYFGKGSLNFNFDFLYLKSI